MVRVAVMGATGAVGREMLLTLEQRDFKCDSIKLLASETLGRQRAAVPWQDLQGRAC